jgi:hypothetical protein
LGPKFELRYVGAYQNQNEGISLVGKFPLRDLKLFFGKDEKFTKLMRLIH